jgi:hypothetical protein
LLSTNRENPIEKHIHPVAETMAPGNCSEKRFVSFGNALYISAKNMTKIRKPIKYRNEDARNIYILVVGNRLERIL